MNIFEPKYHYVIHPEKGIQVKIDEDLSRFNVDLLNIGDLKAPSKTIEVLSVSFDLEAFTIFTRQVDPHLSIPNFISDFFNWLFHNIKHSIKDQEQANTLWAELPFFSKFMGDGVLFLWKIDLDKITQIDKHLRSEQLQKLLQEFISNIITSMFDLCRGYKHFLKSVRTNYVEPPPKLRCGIARGSVYPIGNGLDFVGPCINISSRLQKISSLSFAFSARGIDLNAFHPSYSQVFIKKQVSIRGIGDYELIYVSREEFEKLPDDLQGTFVDL